MEMNHSANGTGVLSSPLVAKVAVAFLVVATLLVGALTVNAVMDFGDADMPAGNLITVEATGEVSAAPDIATINFTVSEDGDSASQAQDVAAKKINVALAVLRDMGIEEGDIKTSVYSMTPRYSYQPPCYTYPCPYSESQRIIGYTAAQTVEVKVRNLDQTGEVLANLGDAGVSNLYGPTFVIDNEDELKAEARKMAIDEARAKAKKLADDLDVRLVRIVNFWESTGPVYPYYGRAEVMGLGGAADAPKSTIADVPVVENEIAVSVSITYEIR